ncbi:MAG: BMP family ABC transporter substrate-binding protein [Actinomycetota bacterium]|nr:BMP family ABC transporter substrate-binding protein [Actinomycetota bacterium]
MRLTAHFAAAVSAAALILAGCAGGSDDGDTEASGDETDSANGSESVCESADGEGPKIGLAYDVGGRGDQSFNDSAYAGLEMAVDELDATCIEAEAGSGEDDVIRANRLRELVDAGYNPIIGVGFVYSIAVDTVAKEVPDVDFAVVDGFNPSEDPAPENVAYLSFAANEGSFLVGAAAALTSETGTVGFVGGTNTPLIQAFEAGFNAGVGVVDDSIAIESQYISQDNPEEGFENPAGGTTAADGMLDAGADVIYHAAGKSGLGVFEAVAAAGEGQWAIGVDSDQYLTASPDQQEIILTSMLKRIDTGVFEYVSAFNDGDAPNDYVTYDLASDGVGYSTSGDHLSEEVIAELESYKEQIVAGDIEVPTTP